MKRITRFEPRRATVLLTVVLSLISSLGWASDPPASGDAVPDRPASFGFVCSLEKGSGEDSAQRWLLVREIVPGGPADQAGLKPGDRIIGIEGEPVRFRSGVELLEGLAANPPGREVRFEVLRDDARLDLIIVPDEMSEVQAERWKAILEKVRADEKKPRSVEKKSLR